MRVASGAALLLLSASCDALAAARLETLLASAKPGSSVRLPAGDYGVSVIADRSWDRPITIDARGARFTRLTLRKVQGIILRGATVTTPNTDIGVTVRESRGVTIENFDVTGARKGIVVDRSEDISIKGNRLSGLRSDGINVALSRRVRIETNSCESFTPLPKTFDANGTMIKDGDHPDCIQAWSRPTHPPTSDLLIAGNRMTGMMQGIGLFNHSRDGVDDGGFDRVVIRNNVIEVGYPHAIALVDARNSVVRDNVVRTVPGAMLPNKPVRVRARVSVTRGADNLVCGNRVENNAPSLAYVEQVCPGVGAE